LELLTALLRKRSLPIYSVGYGRLMAMKIRAISLMERPGTSVCMSRGYALRCAVYRRVRHCGAAAKPHHRWEGLRHALIRVVRGLGVTKNRPCSSSARRDWCAMTRIVILGGF